MHLPQNSSNNGTNRRKFSCTCDQSFQKAVRYMRCIEHLQWNTKMYIMTATLQLNNLLTQTHIEVSYICLTEFYFQPQNCWKICNRYFTWTTPFSLLKQFYHYMQKTNNIISFIIHRKLTKVFTNLSESKFQGSSTTIIS